MDDVKKPDYISGLSYLDVEHSRKKYGANVITKKKKKGFWSQYLASFGDPLIKILLIALSVNVIFLMRTSGWYESAGIAIAVLLATLVSTLSEYGSESAFEKLQQASGLVNCRVRRNGKLILLGAGELVVGDIVLLQAGEKIPADGHMVAGELAVDQSALNGESKEARKRGGGSVNRDSAELSSETALFMGSVVCEGEGVMQVDRVGDSTFYGKLAIEIQEGTTESPLKNRLAKLAKTISRMGYTAAAIVAFANLFNNFVLDCNFNRALIIARITNPAFLWSTILSTITLAITVVVMAVPEGLPMMITVVLSANMKKMLKDNVLVRRLVGIETAGSLNILFTDKTGTLTKGQLSVTTFLSGDGTAYDSISALKKSNPSIFEKLIIGSVYNTDSQISGESKNIKIVGGNATDRALLGYVQPYIKEVKNVSLLSHTPFNSASKYSLSKVQRNGKTLYLIKGAPEIILSRCKYYLDQTGTKKPLGPASLKMKMQYLGEKAVRMLAFAESEVPVDMKTAADLTLIGIGGIRDDIRREAAGAVAQITSAGIQTVMITGDNRETAVAIAREVGLLDGESTNRAVLTGQELALMSDDEVKRRLRYIRVVARAMPTDKSRLVRLSQEMGLVAGMTGDGINDAPALKKADIGFSMGSGTEVAKEAGDIVIIDNNIMSISKAILYGRTIFKSIRKFIIFQLTMNLSAVSLSVICPFLGVDAPLTVMQMLWVNIIMDTLAGLAFAGEAPLKEYMKEPPKRRDDAIMNRYMYSQILFTGVYTTIICLLFLKLPLTQRIFHYSEGNNYFMTAFFALFIFLGVFNSLNARTPRLNIFSYISRNKLFIGIMLCVCVVQILLIYNGGAVFRTVGIHAGHLQLILLIAFSIIPADFIRKLWLRSIGRRGFI